MKTYLLQLSLFTLAVSLFASSAHAAESKMMVRTHTGKEVMAVGTAKGVCRWTGIDGASGYYVHFGPKGNAKTHSLPTKLSPVSNTVEVTYLNPNVAYDCAVEAMLGNGKSIWLPQTVLRSADARTMTPVLGTQSAAGYHPNPVVKKPTTMNGRVPQMALNKKNAPVAPKVTPKVAQKRLPQGVGGAYYGQVAGVTEMKKNDVLGMTTPASWGVAKWNPSAYGALQGVQIYWWSDAEHQYALALNDPNAVKNARELPIKALQPVKYWYRVIGISNGKAVELKGTTPLNY